MRTRAAERPQVRAMRQRRSVADLALSDPLGASVRVEQRRTPDVSFLVDQDFRDQGAQLAAALGRHGLITSLISSAHLAFDGVRGTCTLLVAPVEKRAEVLASRLEILRNSPRLLYLVGPSHTFTCPSASACLVGPQVAAFIALEPGGDMVAQRIVWYYALAASLRGRREAEC